MELHREIHLINKLSNPAALFQVSLTALLCLNAAILKGIS